MRRDDLENVHEIRGERARNHLREHLEFTIASYEHIAFSRRIWLVINVSNSAPSKNTEDIGTAHGRNTHGTRRDSARNDYLKNT